MPAKHKKYHSITILYEPSNGSLKLTPDGWKFEAMKDLARIKASEYPKVRLHKIVGIRYHSSSKLKNLE